MAVPAWLQTLPAAEQRSSPRRKLRLGSSLHHSGQDVIIHDVSATGLLIETEAALAPSDSFELDLPAVGLTQAAVVWTSGRYYGCQFGERLSGAAISAALLRSAPRAERSDANAAVSPRIRAIQTIENAIASKSFDGPIHFEDEKAPLKVRLRVIIGSTIVLWTLIIWGLSLLMKVIKPNLG